VVEPTHVKNISQHGKDFPIFGVKIKMFELPPPSLLWYLPHQHIMSTVFVKQLCIKSITTRVWLTDSDVVRIWWLPFGPRVNGCSFEVFRQILSDFKTQRRIISLVRCESPTQTVIF